MKNAFPYLSGVMGFGILLLALNLQERDSYEFGTETPSKLRLNDAPCRW